jgi:hypothetical protein
MSPRPCHDDEVKSASLVSVLACVFLVVLVSGCAGASAGSTSTTSASFNPAATNAAKCGGCHTPFDPGGHTKEALEKAFVAHKAEHRVALSDAEWSKMADYLAKK